MTHVTCRLTTKNRDQLRNPTIGNQVWATLNLFTYLTVAVGQETVIPCCPDTRYSYVEYTLYLRRRYIYTTCLSVCLSVCLFVCSSACESVSVFDIHGGHSFRRILAEFGIKSTFTARRHDSANTRCICVVATRSTS